MDEQMQFFIYLLERYAEYRGMSAGDVLKEWDAHGITDKVYGSWWLYHIEAIENAYEDIDSLLATGTYVW